MTEQSDLIRSGNRFLQLMADGGKAKVIARDAGLPIWHFWKAVNAARDAAAPPIAADVISLHERHYGRPSKPDPEVAFRLSLADIRILHAIRDEIRAADRRAVEMENDR
jgi:hypothetical protein